MSVGRPFGEIAMLSELCEAPLARVLSDNVRAAGTADDNILAGSAADEPAGGLASAPGRLRAPLLCLTHRVPRILHQEAMVPLEHPRR